MEYNLQIKELQEQIKHLEKMKIKKNKEELITNKEKNIKFIETSIKYLSDARGYFITQPSNLVRRGMGGNTNNLIQIDEIDILSFDDRSCYSNPAFAKQRFNYTNLINSKIFTAILNLVENMNRRIKELEKE